MKYQRILFGFSLSIVIAFVVFFGLHVKRQALHQSKGANGFNAGAVSSQIPTGDPNLNPRRVANGSQQSADPWAAYMAERIDRLYQYGLTNSEVEPPADFREVIRDVVEREVAELKKHYATPPLRIGVEIPEKYTGPQTVESLMETFEAYDRQGTQGGTPELDEKYPRAEWLGLFLEKGGTIRSYTDYSHWLGIRWNLIGFERDGNWVEGVQGVPPMADWETFKATYIDRQVWEHQQISDARQNDSSVRGGTFMGPDDRTFLPYLDGRVYVQRKERGASFFGEMLTQKQQWEIMLLGKHPAGYEIVYVDANGVILSEPPPPIPPPTGEERRQLEAWLKRGGSQRPSDGPDRTAEDWDIRVQDTPSGDETVRADAQAAQERLEQAQAKAFDRATKNDTEIGAELKKQLTPEPPTAAGIETQLSERFSPEHSEQARGVLERYGSEEGMRRLRADDPEAAGKTDREERPTR